MKAQELDITYSYAACYPKARGGTCRAKTIYQMHMPLCTGSMDTTKASPPLKTHLKKTENYMVLSWPVRMYKFELFVFVQTTADPDAAE